MGQQPAYKLIQKDDSPDAKFAWKFVGAAWYKDNGKDFSIVIDMPDGTKFKCLMVENKPKGNLSEAKQEKAAADKNAIDEEKIPF